MNTLTMEDLRAYPERTSRATLVACCTADLTPTELAELATERAGNSREAIVDTITALLNGLEARHRDDDATQAAIWAIRDWHLPDLLQPRG